MKGNVQNIDTPTYSAENSPYFDQVFNFKLACFFLARKGNVQHIDNPTSSIENSPCFDQVFKFKLGCFFLSMKGNVQNIDTPTYSAENSPYFDQVFNFKLGCFSWNEGKMYNIKTIPHLGLKPQPRDQCYKTYYVLNLLIL